MSRSGLVLRTALMIVGVLGVFQASTALAADDDFDFAQALSRRGYTDLAAEKYQELGSSSPDGQYGLSLLKAFEARKAAGETNDKRRKPFAEVLKLFQDADDAQAAFIKRYATHKRNLDAKLERSRLLQQRADYINLALEKGWVDTNVDREKLRGQVAEGFDTAIGLLKPVEQAIRDKIEKLQDVTSPEYVKLQDELGLVWLFRLVAIYGKGHALPPGNSAGTDAFNQVVREIEDYLWDFENSLRGVWALHYRGLASWKLEKYEDAFGDLRDASTYISGSSDPGQRKVTFDSMVRLTEFALEVDTVDGRSYPSLALGVIGPTLEKYWPKRWEDAGGQAAALAHAELLQANGDMPAALEIVQRVLKEAGERNTGKDRDAGELLAAWGGGSAAKLDPSDLVRVAKSYWKQERFDDCIRAYQNVIQACGDDPEDMEAYGWEAWDYIALCYAQQKRYYAAYTAFDVLEQAWLADQSNEKLSEITDESGFRRAGALDFIARRTKRPEDVQAAKTAIEEFTKNHPDSQHNQDAAGREAEAAMKDFRGTPKEPADVYKAKAADAKKACNAVPAASPSKPKYNAYHVEIERRLGNYDAAVKLAEAWLAKDRKADTEAARRRAVARGRAICLAQMLTATNQRMTAIEDDAAHKTACQQMLDAIDKWGAEFLTVASNGQRQINQWQAEALVGVERIDDAEKLVQSVLETAPKHRNSLYLADRMASALVKAANARLAREVPDPRGAEKYFRRAAKLREHILDNQEGRDADILMAVAQTYRKAKEFKKAQELMEEALSGYEAAKAEAKAASVRIQLIDLLIDQGEFDEAIPQLEARFVPNEAERGAIIARLKLDTDVTQTDLKGMREHMTANRAVIDTLSRAYLEAKNKQRLIACINLCHIMMGATKRDDYHNEAWVKLTLRRAKAYLAYGVDNRDATALDSVIQALQSGVFTPGYAEPYDKLVPGFKSEAEQILQTARSERKRM